MSKKSKEKKSGNETIEPKKDWHLNCPPHCDIQIKKGVEIEVPTFLVPSLITEGVIAPRTEK